jgi:hypothetical protein
VLWPHGDHGRPTIDSVDQSPERSDRTSGAAIYQMRAARQGTHEASPCISAQLSMCHRSSELALDSIGGAAPIARDSTK